MKYILLFNINSLYRFRGASYIVACAIFVLVGGLVPVSTASAGSTAPATTSDEGAYLPPVPVCMDFGCKRKDMVRLKYADWKSVADWFKTPAETPEAEREQVKQAIGWMEVVIGRYTPTRNDIGGNLSKDGETLFPGQLDCIDESLNTTTYLKLFEQKGLLTHHIVIDRAYRKSLFDQHWAGQIQSDDGQRWVVDSWFQDNGYLPYIQKSEKWEKIPLITSYLDSSQPRGNDDSRSWLERMLVPDPGQ